MEATRNQLEKIGHEVKIPELGGGKKVYFGGYIEAHNTPR